MAETTTAELLDAVDLRVAALLERVRALAAELAAVKHHGGGSNGSVLPLFPEIQAAVTAAPEIAVAAASRRAENPVAEDDVHCDFPEAQPDSVTPDRLRVQMSYAGLTKSMFSDVFGVPAEAVHAWLAGERAIPPWVLPAVYIFELLTPAERKSFMRPSAARSGRNPAKVHPFARIEEL